MTDYYVDGAVGNDANAGTAEGAGNAWATIQKAESTMVAGDRVYIKASATYAETVTLSLSFNTSQQPVWYEGYTSTPGDGGRCTIDPPSGFAMTTNFLTKNFRFFKNIRFTGATTGYHDDSGDYAMFINCEFDNCSNDGVLTDNYALFIGCSFHDNSRYGANSGIGAAYVDCVFYNNASSAINAANSFCVGSLFHSNADTGAAISGSSSGGPSLIHGNTIYHEPASASANGYNQFQAYQQAVINNIFANGAGGVILSLGSQPKSCFVDYNLFYNLTTDVDTNAEEGANNITGSDPLFTDASTDDYSLQASSPAKDTGLVPSNS